MICTDLRVDGLRFTYPPLGNEPPRCLFEGLTFRIDAGQTGVLLGAADAGKTTLSRMLVGLVPRFTGGDRDGAIRCGAIDVCAAQPWDLVEAIGLVFQDSDSQVFTTRCDTEVAFALESLGVPRGEIARRIEESLRLVGLAAFTKRNPSTLSGGEKKRLLLACLAAIDPAVWVLDESLEELDADWKVRIMDILRDRGRTTLVLDSRWAALLEERGDSFGILSAGTVSSVSGRPVTDQLRSGLREHGIAVGAGQRAARGPRPAGDPFLKAEGIRYSFPDSDGFTLDVESLVVEKGTVCGLVGPNGSGKSTLGKVLCGLLTPRAGVVALNDGGGFRPARGEELNRRIGYLFQNPDHQIYLPTVQEELGLGLAMRGVGRREAEDLVREAARLFALPDLLAQPGAHELRRAPTAAGRDVLASRTGHADSRRGGFGTVIPGARGPDARAVRAHPVCPAHHARRAVRRRCLRPCGVDGGRAAGRGLRLPCFPARGGSVVAVDFFKPGTSFLHRFDPRAKLLLLAPVTVSLLIPAPVVVSACLVAFLLGVIGAAFGPSELTVPLRPILPVLILIALLTPLFHRSGTVLLAVRGFALVTGGGLRAALAMILRFGGISLAFFAAFRSIELDDLVLALRWFGLPYSACLVVIIAFRSLPSLASTYRNVQDAHRLRCGPASGARHAWRGAAKTFLPILTSVLIQAVKGIPVLAMVLESRGFGRPNPRSSFAELKRGGALAADLAVAAGLSAVCLLAVLLVRA